MSRRLDGTRAMLGSHSRLLVVVLAVLATAITVGVAERVFPHGTTDLDEVSFQTQANVLRHGHLDLDAARRVPHFVPFLSGVRGNRVIFKYQPEWPAAIAVSDSLFGSSLPLRMLCSAAGVLVVAWLAWELTRTRLVALLAAAFVAMSPFTWVQSASLLGYQLSFVLGIAATSALLKAARDPSTGAGLVAGVLLGLAVLHRPFDAALAVVPVVGYLAWTYRGALARPRLVATVFMGATPLVATLLAYNAAVMGSALRLPYSVTGKQDAFFFGWRATYVPPGTGRADEIPYTLGRAWSTLGHDLALLPRFVALAPLVLFFAGAAVWAGRKQAECWLLVGMIATVIGGYFFWWGTANAELFGIDRGLGPFYDYAALAPLCILGAWGVTTVRLPARWLVPLVVVASIFGAVASWNVLSYARREGRIRSAEVQLTQPSSPRPTLVIVPPVYPGDPYLRYSSDDRLDAKRLVALDVPGRRLELVTRYPDRDPFLVRAYRPFGDPFGATTKDRVRLTVVRGPRLTMRLRTTVRNTGAGSAYLRIGDRPPVVAASGRGELRGSWTLAPAMLPSDRTTTVAVGVTIGQPGGPAPRNLTGEWYECRFELRASAKDLEALTPCDGWQHYLFPDGRTALSNENVAKVLDVSVAAGPD